MILQDVIGILFDHHKLLYFHFPSVFNSTCKLFCSHMNSFGITESLETAPGRCIYIVSEERKKIINQKINNMGVRVSLG